MRVKGFSPKRRPPPGTASSGCKQLKRKQPPKPPPKPPLGNVTNVATQQQVDALKRHLKLQADVINGLCRLRAFEAENRSPT